ncbi:hypothetical protein K3495_g9698 [Podosphaera aphanis]|nr:hypothetical protein K3495_g9698 [Podosphaera aphanis]
MGRELQKKKNRSSISKVKIKPKSKKVNPLANAIVAANWNRHETLTQNYKRLGLTARLNSATGGIEKLKPSLSKTFCQDKLAISNVIPKTIKPSEARVERDPHTGKILRVIHTTPKSNPLNDLILSDSEDESLGTHGERVKREKNESNSENQIIRQLEEQASACAPKKIRKQSEREQVWIANLVSSYGEDYIKMARDRKLNPMQQTPADIQRRVEKWKVTSRPASG